MSKRLLHIVFLLCFAVSPLMAGDEVSGQPNTPDTAAAGSTQGTPSTVTNSSSSNKRNVSSLENDEGYLNSVILSNSKYARSIDSGLMGKLNEITKGVEQYNKEHKTLPGFQGARDRDFAHLKSYTTFQQGLVAGLKVVLYLAIFILLCRAGILLQMGSAEGAMRIGIGLAILITVCSLLEPFFNLMAKMII